MSADLDFGIDEDKVEPRDTNVLSSSRTPSGRARAGRRPGEKRLSTLKGRLTDEMKTAGAMIGLGLPTTGCYIYEESESVIGAVVDLAAKRAEWLAALEKTADIGPGITVGRFGLGFIAAIGVDRERIDPSKRFCQFTGVTNAYLIAHPEEANDGNDGAGVYVPPPVSSWVPVA